MNWFQRWMERFKVVFRKELAEEELNDELRYHLEREVREKVQAGMTPEQARRKAMVEFGGVERTKEQVRDARGARGLDDLIRDFRVAFRSFARQPGFALTAATLMAVGIGSTTAIFSVVDGVVLSPLPYPDAEELVFFDNGGHNWPNFLAFQESLTSLDEIAALSNADASISGGNRTTRISIANVTPGFFPMLGGRALQGRLFSEQEYLDDARLVVLDHGFWVRNWGGDPSILGTQIRMDGEPIVVVGVLDPAFHPPEAITVTGVEAWVLATQSEALRMTRGSQYLGVLGRLRDGVSLEVAQAEVEVLTASLAQEFPDDFFLANGSRRSFPPIPLRDATVRGVSGNLVLLLGAVGLLLLIACANVANLFLARGTSRAGELALRGALGASSWRITRQLLSESSAITLVGGLVGVALAYLGVGLFVRLGPQNVPRLAEVAVDPRALLFALSASVATGVLCGVFPVFQAASKRAAHQIRDNSARGSTGKGKRRIRDGLVVAELALSMVLLTGAGILTRSLMERLQVDPGLESEGLAVFALQVGDSYTTEERIAFVRDLKTRLEATPEVRSVAGGWAVPFIFPENGCCWNSQTWPVESSENEGLEPNFIHPVTPGYFETLGVPMAQGREFTEADLDENTQIAVLTPKLAQRMFGDADPLGKEIMVGGNGPVTVVGVEAGVHHWTLDIEVGEAVYVPYQGWGAGWGLLHLVVRLDRPLSAAAPTIREVIRGLDPDMATDEIVTMDQLISRTLATPRLLSVLFSAFAIVALFLACGGVYASVLYSVGQRKREMGIRLALGAENGQIARVVLGDGAILAAIGLGVGLVGSLAVSRLFATVVWGVSTTDTWTYLTVTLLLGLSTLAACWVPAIKASRTNLVETLKAE